MIIEAKNRNDNIIKLPNGCCTNDNCDLKLFYKLFIQEHSKNN